ncbi:MAG TPA: hypothetical protein VJN70_16285 [Gemmatimonadaceae bacterium]|nr:hypothetical protein [Gemmatimonadaceae bacterium]
MSISRRTFARAGVLAIGALTLASCKDSGTTPLNVTPDQLQSVGQSVATELEAGVAELTAQDVMSTNGGAPTFSRVPRSAATMTRGLAFSRTAGAADIAQCGVPSQSPPVDTDGDLIPDNWSLTFSLPACHFSDQTNSYDITGALRISDLQPTTPSLSLNFALDNFKLAFSGANGSGYVSRNGSGSVTASASGLSQTENWTEGAVLTGVTSATVGINWTATFTAAQGQSITAGQSLPDGAYTPNGTVSFRQGNRAASFTVTTLAPLQYSAACAYGVTQGTSLAPFTGGHIRVDVTSQQGSGYADVTYSSCNSATVTFVSQ